MIRNLIRKIRGTPTVEHIYQVYVSLSKPSIDNKKLFLDRDQTKETYKFLTSLFVTYVRNSDTAYKAEIVKNIMSTYLSLYSKNGGEVKDISQREKDKMM